MISKRARDRLLMILFLSPAVIIMVVWMGYPLLYSLWSSFYKIDITKSVAPRFVGLRHYLGLIKDPIVHGSFRITLIYTGMAVCFQFVIGFGLALLLYPTRVKRLATPLFVIPMVIPPVVAAVVWKIMYDLTHGIFNYFLMFLGLNGISWLGDSSVVLISLALVEIWQNTPFVLLVLSAGLASLPTTPYEAAKIDGASPYALFRYLTVPLLKPFILVVLLIRTMLCFRVFDHVYVLTQGGPGRSTTVLGYWAYKVAFGFWHTGEAAALSYIMVGITSCICVLYMRVLRK